MSSRPGLHAAAARAAREEAEADTAVNDVARAVAAFAASTPETRAASRARYIQRKQLARALLHALPPSAAAVATEMLAESVTSFRVADAGFYEADRGALLVGRATLANSYLSRGHSRARDNDSTLAAAATVSSRSNTALTGAAVELEMTLGVARATANHLEEDRARILKIDEKYDDVDGELSRSRALVVRFLKRLSTDKIFLALCFLVFTAAVGLAIYAAVDTAGFLAAFKPAPLPPPV